MSNLKEHAKKELEIINMFDKDSDYNGEVGKAVMDLVETFDKQGHSGSSAVITLKLFERIARLKPLTPLTDNPDEWSDIDGKGLFQSKRNSECFSSDGFKTYKNNSTGEVISLENK